MTENMNEELIRAARNKEISKVKSLIKQGANVNFKDKFGGTPLFYAVTKSDFELTKFFLENNADINMLYDKKDNLLQLAVIYHGRLYFSTDIIEFLINEGIDINHKNIHGNTPLFSATTQWAVNKDVIEILVQNGADMDIKNKHGMSAYDIAVQNDLPELKNLFDMLREKYRV